MEQVERAARRDRGRDEQRRAPSSRARARDRRDRDRSRHRREVHRLSACRPRRARTASRSDGRPRSRRRSPGTRRARRAAEHDRRGQPVGARPANDEAEDRSRDEPDEDVPEDRRRGVARELVERQRLADARPGRQRADEVQPAGRRRRDDDRERQGCALYAAPRPLENARYARAALPRQIAQLCPPRTT